MTFYRPYVQDPDYLGYYGIHAQYTGREMGVKVDTSADVDADAAAGAYAESTKRVESHVAYMVATITII